MNMASPRTIMFVHSGRKIGGQLSDTASNMHRQMSKTLMDERISINMPIGMVEDKHDKQLPVYIESTDVDYTLYVRSGPDRKMLMKCRRSSAGFTVVSSPLTEGLDLS